MEVYPRIILLIGGKRKSGKDYATDVLINRLGADRTVVIRISGPIKSHWAKSHELSFEELLSSGSLKELHRLDMIKWSEEKRNSDHGIFCREAIKMYKAQEKPIWIVSDIRRKTDIIWFQENYPDKVKTVKIYASESTRKNRGWKFTAGIDDAPTECDLDDMNQWDWQINNDDSSEFSRCIDKLVEFIVTNC